MDYARPESKSTKTYTTWVTFDDQPDNKNYDDENDFHPKFFGRSKSMPTGHKSTPITISRKNNSKILDKTETESIFHQWANLENSNSSFKNSNSSLENSNSNLENSFSNSLDSVATTSTPKSFSRQNSETSSFASSIGKKHALKNMSSLL